MSLNVFNSIDHLEPKCPGCDIKIDYGVNTKFDEEHDAHVCQECGAIIK